MPSLFPFPTPHPPQARDQLMDWVAEREVRIYQAFSASGGANTSKLERFDRRFHWCVACGCCMRMRACLRVRLNRRTHWCVACGCCMRVRACLGVRF